MCLHSRPTDWPPIQTSDREFPQAEQKKRKIWKLVLTGGPCGGKTTGQARLSTFFENLGWKVYRVPETATVLLGGGVNFADLPEYAQIEFQVETVQIFYKHLEIQS